MARKTKKKEKQPLFDKVEIRKFLIVLFVAIITGVIIFGFTYVWSLMDQSNEPKEYQKLVNVELGFNNFNSSRIVVENMLPMTEAGGRSTDSYEFSIKNVGTEAANYAISLDEDLVAINSCVKDSEGNGCNFVSSKELRYVISKNGEEMASEILSTDNNVIDMGTIEVGQTITYRLRIWVDEEALVLGTDGKFAGILGLKVQAN